MKDRTFDPRELPSASTRDDDAPIAAPLDDPRGGPFIDGLDAPAAHSHEERAFRDVLALHERHRRPDSRKDTDVTTTLSPERPMRVADYSREQMRRERTQSEARIDSRAQRSHARRGPMAHAPHVDGDRAYPKMKALLQNPDAPLPRHWTLDDAQAPVLAADALEGLLEHMAAGVFVGGRDGSLNEIRITLNDTYFGGTELAIALEPDGVVARFFPSDGEAFRMLHQNIRELHERLENRNIRVRRIEIVDPP